MNCPLCKIDLKEAQDKIYLRCISCNAWVMDKRFYLSEEQEQERYLKHVNDVDDPGYIHYTSPITRGIVDLYTPEHFGLDYGCGPGPVISRQLKEKGFSIQLYDPFFFPDESYLDKKYDYIFACEVVEHFHYPEEEFRKLLGLLKEGGRLYLMTQLWSEKIDFKNWHYRRDPTHVFIYTEETIRYVAKAFQLTIEELHSPLIVFIKK